MSPEEELSAALVGKRIDSVVSQESDRQEGVVFSVEIRLEDGTQLYISPYSFNAGSSSGLDIDIEVGV